MTDRPSDENATLPNSPSGDEGNGARATAEGPPGRASASTWLVGADWIVLGGLVGLAVLARIIYVVQSGDWPYFDCPVSDAALYLDRAQGILGGYWPSAKMAHSQGPLYPYLLAGVLAVTDGHRIMLAVQMALGCASVSLVYLVTRRAGYRLSAVMAALLCLGYAPLVANEGKLLTESMATFLSLLAAYGLIRQVDKTRWGWALVAGLSLGAASGLRPSFLLVVPLAAGWVWHRHRRSGGSAVLPGAAICATAGAAIAPFTWHNLRAEGELIPISSAGGITFFLGNNPTAAGTLSFGGVITGGVGTQHREQLARAEAVLGRKLTSGEASKFWYKRGLRFISKYPRWWAWIMWRKFRLFFSSEEVANVYSFRVERSVISILRFLVVPFGVIGALGLVGVALSLRRAEAQPIFILLAVGFATCMVFYTSSRFRMPMVPLMAVLGGWGVERAVLWWRKGYRRGSVASGLVAVLLTVLMAWPVGRPLPSSERFGRRNLASMLARAGQPDRAREMLRPQLDPKVPVDDRSEAYLALGRIELDQRRCQQAIKSLEMALELDPHNFAPHRELAKAHYHLGRYAEAVEHARALLDRNSRDVECHGLIGKCFIRQKQWAAAIAELQQTDALEPNNPGVLCLLGQAYAGNRQYEKAIAFYRRSLGLRTDPTVMVSLAACLARVDQKDEARRLLARVLAANPDDPKARALLRQLGGLGGR